MKAFQTFSMVALTAFSAFAFAGDPQSSIKQLDERLYKLGAPKLEGVVMVKDKEVPAIYFGARRINNNYDVVDEIKSSTGATATVFVKSGDEFVRVSTNVLTPEGKRGVGTNLARNKAYESITAGKSYCGDIDVLGTAYSACYNPIKDGGGKTIGVTYVGHKK